MREASAKQSRLNKARIRLAPVSAGVGLLVGLALFAALGWRPILLLGTAGLTALGWAVVVLFTVRRVPVPPLAETQRIWFWLVPPDSDPPAWVVASHANAHWPDESVKGPPYYWSWLGSAAALCGAALCLVSAVTWYATTSTLYVVNTHEEDVVLFVDGKRRGTISTHIRADDDVPVEHFRLPEGLHHIQIAAVGGAAIGSVDVDLESDTIYAPGARRLGLCFLDEVVWYAQSNPRPSEVCALETSDDLLKTGSVYDFYLSSPPQTVRTNHGLSTSRRGLRAVLCDTDGVEHPPIQPCR